MAVLPNGAFGMRIPVITRHKMPMQVGDAEERWLFSVPFEATTQRHMSVVVGQPRRSAYRLRRRAS